MVALIRLYTTILPDFFYGWKKEVASLLADRDIGESHKYIVFEHDGDTFVYLIDGDADDALSYTDIDVDVASITPAYCNPHTDASMTTFGEFAEETDAPFSDFALEDITIEDLMRRVSEDDSSATIISCSVNDVEVAAMCTFVNLALPRSDSSKLRSFVNRMSIDKGFGKVFKGEPVAKYNKLEIGSEMMKCNPGLYMKHKNGTIRSMLATIGQSRSKAEMEHGLSGLAYEILSDNVVSCLGSTWCFTGGVWVEYSSDGYIWNFLTTDFIDFLKGEDVDDLALFMMSVTTRTRVMKDVKLRLQDDSFHTLLDSKRNVIRMKNGVYDTNTGTLTNPVPSDYTSVIAGVPFDSTSARVGTLMGILSTIFPDERILDFFMVSCSTFLEGYNSPKVFYIWWGMGNNAKSLVQALVMKTFGEYCSTAPTSLVTGKRGDSSNATPELCHVERRLVVFLQEPNPDEKIKAGKMKEMTGNDTMYVRQLFKSGKTMTLKAKLVIVCNNVLEIPGMDAAIRRRMVVIPFVSTFLDPNEYKSKKIKGSLEPNSFIIDLSVERELLKCKSAFMFLLCKRYEELKNKPLDIPQVIRRVTDEYITLNNLQLKFISTFVAHVPGSAVAASEIYEHFKDWHKKSYPGKKLPDYEKFAKEMSDEGYREDGYGVIRDVHLSYNGDLVN